MSEVVKLKPRKKCTICGKRIWGKAFRYFKKTFPYGTTEYIPIDLKCAKILKVLEKALSTDMLDKVMKVYGFSTKTLIRIEPIKTLKQLRAYLKTSNA